MHKTPIRKAAVLAAQISADIIILVAAHGSMGCPSGLLYARLPLGFDMETFQAIIDALKECSVIAEVNNCFYANMELRDDIKSYLSKPVPAVEYVAQ